MSVTKVLVLSFPDLVVSVTFTIYALAPFVFPGGSHVTSRLLSSTELTNKLLTIPGTN